MPSVRGLNLLDNGRAAFSGLTNSHMVCSKFDKTPI